MKPFHRSTASSAADSIVHDKSSKSQNLLSDGTPQNTMSSSTNTNILRGGGSTMLEEEEYEYIDDNDEGYYYAEEDYADYGEDTEYEYYEDDGIHYEDVNSEEEDRYYYGNEYDDEEYIDLPDDESQSYQSYGVSSNKKRGGKLLPSIRKSILSNPMAISTSISLPSLPITAITNNLNTLSNSLGGLSNSVSNVLPNGLAEVNGSGSVLLISVVGLLLLSVRSIIILFGLNKGVGGKGKSKNGKKKKGRKKNGKRSSLLSRFGLGKGKGNKKEGSNEEKKESYGDYSKGYPGEQDDDEDMMDLDLDDSTTVNGSSGMGSSGDNGKVKRYPNRQGKRQTFISTIKVVPRMVNDVWIGVCNVSSRYVPALSLGVVGRIVGSRGKSSIDELEAESEEIVIEANTPDNNINEALEEAEDKASKLQQQLDTLTSSNTSLEQEYEASLRMLHEARLELRQLQANQQQNDVDSTGVTQKEQLEQMAKKLKTKYEAQMKDSIERIKSQLETKLRTEAEANLTTTLRTEITTELKEEQSKLEEQLKLEMEERLADVKRITKEELTSNFQRSVDEAAAIEIEKTIDAAVQNAINIEQQKSREEMLKVRQGIQKVLERERRLMREQVRETTSRVREWVVKQQQEQLLQQAAQLQEEAASFGSRGGNSSSGSGQQQQQRRGGQAVARQQQGGVAAARRTGGVNRQQGKRPQSRPRDGY